MDDNEHELFLHGYSTPFTVRKKMWFSSYVKQPEGKELIHGDLMALLLD